MVLLRKPRFGRSFRVRPQDAIPALVLLPGCAEAAYQTAYQSLRTQGDSGTLAHPSGTLSASTARRQTVDGMEEVRGSNPLSSTHNRPGQKQLTLR
jgi:hypothetical protein